MVEDIQNFSARVLCIDDFKKYLDEKGVDYLVAGFDPQSGTSSNECNYHVPPEPSDWVCWVLNRIPQRFWERVVRVGLEHSAANHNVQLKYLWREFVDHHNDDMKIVLYVVNK